jgi:hypothetical protein
MRPALITASYQYIRKWNFPMATGWGFLSSSFDQSVCRFVLTLEPVMTALPSSAGYAYQRSVTGQRTRLANGQAGPSYTKAHAY